MSSPSSRVRSSRTSSTGFPKTAEDRGDRLIPSAGPLPEIPAKPYFKIGEVAAIAGVKPSVLRFWESQFRWLSPEKTRSNQRVYTRKQVERVLEIKSLLYDQKFTIAGARRKLGRGGGEADEVLEAVKKEMRELLILIDE